MRMIRHSGTAQERADLEEWLLATAPEETRAVAQKLREYSDKVFSKKSGPSEDTKLQEARKRLVSTMMRGRSGYGSPEYSPDVLYHASKELLWESYKLQVVRETGNTPSIKPGDNLSVVLAQVAHWLVGLEQWQSPIPGECISPLKSLYLFGGVGTGKSTLAIAAHYASRQLDHVYKTGMMFGMTSMDQMVTKIYARQTLGPVEKLSTGHAVIDELRLKHVGYKHFGNDVSIVADILLNRHHAWKQSGHHTIITTNVPPASPDPERPGLINALSDERITSRLMQQYQIVKMDGASFRTLHT